jgi:diguanylate cyclase (GGDEF)-like protein
MRDRGPKPAVPSVAGDEDEGEETRIGTLGSQAPSASGRARPFLVVLAGSSVGEMFALKQPELVVGRSRGASIRLDDDGVSRKHAKLTLRPDGVQVEDLESANGTFVNDQKLSGPRLLNDGDKITLGSTTILKFTYTDDVEEQFQRRMFQAALRDGLTRAYNRSYMLERLGKEVAFSVRHGTPLTLLMFDVDHFKKVNDTYGHPAGDAVLVAIAEIAQANIRAEDVFARLGGEEFGVLCRAVDVKNAAILAERLRARIEATRVKHEATELAVTVSIGLASLSELTSASAEKLIAAADEALYEAKRSGRNRFVVSRPSRGE